MKKSLTVVGLNLTNESIAEQSKEDLKNILKTKVKETVFKLLKDKIKTKGKQIDYKSLRMANYLSSDYSASITEKRIVIQIRLDMAPLYSVFKKIQGLSSIYKTRDAYMNTYRTKVP